MKITEAKRICKELGYVLARTVDNEVRVRRIGAPKDEGYFTDDLVDAVSTCRAMANAASRLGCTHDQAQTELDAAFHAHGFLTIGSMNLGTFMALKNIAAEGMVNMPKAHREGVIGLFINIVGAVCDGELTIQGQS